MSLTTYTFLHWFCLLSVPSTSSQFRLERKRLKQGVTVESKTTHKFILKAIVFKGIWKKVKGELGPAGCIGIPHMDKKDICIPERERHCGRHTWVYIEGQTKGQKWCGLKAQDAGKTIWCHGTKVFAIMQKYRLTHNNSTLVKSYNPT